MSRQYCQGGQHEDTENQWWEYDARGIPLCKVCTVCVDERLAEYRPEVRRDPNYSADESIEPDPTVLKLSGGINWEMRPTGTPRIDEEDEFQ